MSFFAPSEMETKEEKSEILNFLKNKEESLSPKETSSQPWGESGELGEQVEVFNDWRAQ